MAINGSGPDQIQDIFGARGVYITRLDARILNALLCREKWLFPGEIADRVWGDQEDGGPLDTNSTINTRLVHIRRAIKRARIPWKIIGYHGIGGHRLRYLHENSSSPHACAVQIRPQET